jgi:hypothetical protein
MTDDEEYRRILAHSAFIKMLAANDKLTQKSKIAALKNLVKKAGKEKLRR